MTRKTVSRQVAFHLLIVLSLGVVIAGCYYLLDRPAAIWAHGLVSARPGIVAFFKGVTALGGSGPYLVGLAALYAALRYYRRLDAAQRALFVFAAIVISGVTVDVLKALVARWRPNAFFAEPSQYGFAFFKIGYIHNSFPSGHATTAGALACALTLLYPRLRVLWIAAASVVAASRVVVGSHYPGDVVAGAWFGVVITLALSRASWFRAVLDAPEGAP